MSERNTALSKRNTGTPARNTDLWRETMARVADRNQQALAELYDGTSRIVYGMAMRILKDPSSAEDITLEVYLQVWRSAKTYDSRRGSVAGWLLTLARSRSIDCLRARKTWRIDVQEPLSEAAAPRDTRPNPERMVVDAGRARVVQNAIAKLPADQRAVIELSYFSGLSHGEIAQRSSVPLGTVKTRIRLGMLRLREFLQPCQAAL
jgi:RNA polymerase sigma-70 factor (ECF subfamily)